MGQGRSGDLERCAQCGSQLPDEVWCPVVTTTDDDGDPRVLSFCDDVCKDAWRRDGATSEGW